MVALNVNLKVRILKSPLDACMYLTYIWRTFFEFGQEKRFRVVTWFFKKFETLFPRQNRYS